MNRNTDERCRVCLEPLTTENWRPSAIKFGARICRPCDMKHSRDYYHANKERLKAEVTKWGRANPEKKREINLRSKAKLRNQILMVYGSKCACCGESTPEFLHVDHIGGGGNQHRKSLFSTKTQATGTTFYTWLKRQGFPKDRFRLLCVNCNFAIGHYGKCPHGNLP